MDILEFNRFFIDLRVDSRKRIPNPGPMFCELYEAEKAIYLAYQILNARFDKYCSDFRLTEILALWHRIHDVLKSPDAQREKETPGIISLTKHVLKRYEDIVAQQKTGNGEHKARQLKNLAKEFISKSVLPFWNKIVHVFFFSVRNLYRLFLFV